MKAHLPFYLYIPLLILFSSFPAEKRETSDTLPSNLEKELLKKLPEARNEKKLDILHQLQQLNLYTNKDKYYNDLLLEEATAQKNNDYQSIGLSNRVAYYFRRLDTDSIFYYADLAEKFDRENKFYKDLFLVRQMVVYRYFDQGEFSLGFKYAEEMNAEALKIDDPYVKITTLITLARTYVAIRSYNVAINFLLEALDIKEKELEKAPYKRLECYIPLIDSYKRLDNYSMVEKYCDQMKEEIEKIELKYPTYNLSDFKNNLLFYSTYILIRNGDLDEAQKKIEEGEKRICENKVPTFKLILDNIKLHYYAARGDRKNVKHIFDATYQYCIDNHLENETFDLLLFEAETLHKVKEYEMASDAYRALYLHNDSISKERYLSGVDQLRMEYELDRKEDEIQQQKELLTSQNRFNLILGISILALLFTLYIILKNMREIREKNRLLFSQIKELNRTKKELQEFKDLVQEKTFSSRKENGANGKNKLFEETELHMLQKRPFIRSEYGRKDLVQHMGTNEVYLSKAIREASDMTIQEYINSWRMEYAKQLLLEDMGQTIESVATSAGFTSIRSFYRLFKEAHGMSPNEFRNYTQNT